MTTYQTRSTQFKAEAAALRTKEAELILQYVDRAKKFTPKGQVVLRRTLAAGEVVGASGALPLKVIVGRANATQVEIRGKVFDVNAVAKDNVARFEVK